jgi:hypothetical protein
VQWSSLINPAASDIWALAAGCAMLCAALVVALILLSFRHQRREQLYKELDAQWRPWLQKSLFGPVPLQQMPPDGLRGTYVAHIWLDSLLRIAEGSRQPLCLLARQCGVAEFALKVLRHPRWQSPDTLETCVSLAGILRVQRSQPFLEKLLRHRAPSISFAVALALLRLNPQQVKLVWSKAPLFRWSKAALLTLLKTIPSHQVDRLVQHRIEHSSAKDAAQLLAAWAQLPGRAAAQYASKLLSDPNTEGWLLCAALRMQDDVTKVGQFRHYLEHPRWSVRLLALQAVAKLGFGQDLQLIHRLKDNENWWVHIRAREAILAQELEES